MSPLLEQCLWLVFILAIVEAVFVLIMLAVG
jgi:hypothetical protein